MTHTPASRTALSSASTAGTGAGETASRKPAICRIADALSEIAGLVAGAALIVATLVTGWGVFVRYVLKAPTTWQTETTIYLLICVAFLGAAYGVRHNAHVGVDLLPEALPLRGRLILRIITTVLVLGVVGVVGWTGWVMWEQAYALDTRSASAWGPPLWVPYAFLPLGMALVFFQYLAELIEAALALAGRLDPAHVTLLGATGEAAEIQAEIDAHTADDDAAGRADDGAHEPPEGRAATGEERP
ncbi:TRAP transporter small permease [Brevibacterium luteolum]|uniref:TRAP transporter small permease subunit n=1 Tax=Brevibacterium luteolum TaxID=199591 RepID=UPI00158491B3|nr:TRAP transporter small permease [Brevibacterium luteolum]